MLKKLALGLQILVATCLLAGVTVVAATVGTEADPLVSKSYVDSKIEQVLTLINGNGTGSTPAAPQADTDAIVAKVLEQLNQGDGLTGGSVPVDTYVPVSVKVGQTIYGGEGTELVLRAGKGQVKISGVDGIANLTTGAEMGNGAKAVKNQLMVVPRNDGRGIYVTEAAWFLVKGSYEIK